MDLERVKCKFCGKFPDGEIYECASDEHIVCVACCEKRQLSVCVCGGKFVPKKLRNPIEQLVNNAKTVCRYKPNGCTWKFTFAEMDSHVRECKFRPYRCVASSLNVLRCEWIGLQYEIERHLVECHKELGPVFRYAESSSFVFNEHVSVGGLKVVDAFSKRFLLHHFSDADKKTLSFIMIYFGRREESDQYFFVLNLRSLPGLPERAKKPSSDAATAGAASASGAVASLPVRVAEGVKFVERCYSDSENLIELMEAEQCVTLTYRQVRKYLYNGKIYFNYKVCKVDALARDRKVSEQETAATATAAAADVSAPAKNKPRPPPFKFEEKGALPTNAKRSVSSSSSTSSTDTSSSSGSSSSSKTSSGSDEAGSHASRSPSSASTVALASARNSEHGATGKGSLVSGGLLSSINRNPGSISPFDKPNQCYLLTPSINKLDLPPSWAATQTTTTSLSYHQSTEYRQMHVQEAQHGKRYPPTELTTTAAIIKEYTQPYKAQDHRPYLMKHPENCLYKPKQKW